LISFNYAKEKPYRHNFKTLVRKVDANINQENERLIFKGAALSTAGNDTILSLEYSERNLNFHFAAPFFQAENETEYRYLMAGYDDDWSVWSKKTQKSYTNLNPGDYSFKVQARNIYLHPGEEGIYKFKILPPWYRTWWMITLYGILFISSVFLLVHRRSIKLLREKERLERKVEERTKEIRQKNLQLDRQSRELKEMDKVKSRFFANISHEFRTPLTMIMSPIEEMQTKLHEPPKEKHLDAMLRNSQRLLTSINQLLELSRFDSGKVKIIAANQDIVP
ncbi:MAG: hybrid sensor histidine kinase/response regulator, partial [bacterium]|nr:hybrid sensor histidine kinase/response regulator [bacterium]